MYTYLGDRLTDHQLKCPTCGEIIDMRDLGQALSHGNWNESIQMYECSPITVDIPYSSSRKVGDSVEWTKDKKPINLN